MAKVQLIVVEAGHGLSNWGTKDCGAVGRFGESVYIERNIAKEIAKRMLVILKGKPELKGCHIIQGVGIETEATKGAKTKFVNTVIRENRLSAEKCLGVSVHMNSFGNNKPRGFEVWHQRSGKAVALAESMVRAWAEYRITPLRPTPIINTKKHRYGKLYIDDTVCPFVLVEVSFISNLEDVKAITEHYDRVAECLCHGVLEHVRSL
jgi:N-acetylmuramoyl-L-alanine amidase